MHLDDVLTELVEHSGDRLLRVAYQLTHDAAAAQNLVQEALLRVYQKVEISSDWADVRADYGQCMSTSPAHPSGCSSIRRGILSACAWTDSG